MSAFGGLIGVGDDLDVEIDDVLGDADFEKVAVDSFLGDAGIVDDDVGVFGDEVAADVDRGGFAGVVGVLLEGEAEDRDTFAGDRVEESADDLFHKAGFLPVVHSDDRAPVGSRLGQVEGFAEVDEVEYVLLETRTAEADRGFEEFRTDPGVAADGSGDLIYVRTGGFAECGDGVDGGNALGEEGVGDEFGKFGGPEVGGDDSFARHPVGIDRDKCLEGFLSFGCLLAAD